LDWNNNQSYEREEKGGLRAAFFCVSKQ